MVLSTAGPSWLGNVTLSIWDWNFTDELELVPLKQPSVFGDGLRDTQCLEVAHGEEDNMPGKMHYFDAFCCAHCPPPRGPPQNCQNHRAATLSTHKVFWAGGQGRAGEATSGCRELTAAAPACRSTLQRESRAWRACEGLHGGREQEGLSPCRDMWEG